MEHGIKAAAHIPFCVLDKHVLSIAIGFVTLQIDFD